jgi:hypothetical protein
MRPTRALSLSIAIVLTVAAAPACTTQEATDGSPSAQASAQASASSGESAEQQPSAEPSASDGQTGWTQVAEFGDDADNVWSIARDVTHGKAGFLAWGERYMGGIEGGPRGAGESLWRSADGLTWEELPMPEQVSGDVDFTLVKTLISTPEGDYVLYFDRHELESNTTRTLALRSSDGTSWEEVETGLAQWVDIDSIERGDRGYLLIGNQVSGGNPTLWLSTDGIAWELVHEFAQDTEFVQVNDGGAGDEGFVVFGRRIAEDNSYARFAFASGDGREWIETTSPLGPDDQTYVPDVIVEGFGSDWIATVASRDDSARFWFSTNGIIWEPISQIDGASTSIAWDPVLTSAGGELFFSVSGHVNFDGVPGAWSSADGITWEPIEMGADAYLGGVVEGPDSLVLTGTIVPESHLSTIGIWMRTGG